jgi:putative transposase
MARPHVTARGNHRQDIFFKHADRQLLDEIMSEALERSGARIHAYCWMTNHVHLLVQVGERPLGRLMQQVGARFARTIQKELRTTGHLFENRYHALLVDVDNYFLELLRYIHLNPVRAHIVSLPQVESPRVSRQVDPAMGAY